MLSALVKKCVLASSWEVQWPRDGGLHESLQGLLPGPGCRQGNQVSGL